MSATKPSIEGVEEKLTLITALIDASVFVANVTDEGKTQYIPCDRTLPNLLEHAFNLACGMEKDLAAMRKQ
jgi:hypothetical protein